VFDKDILRGSKIMRIRATEPACQVVLLPLSAERGFSPGNSGNYYSRIYNAGQFLFAQHLYSGRLKYIRYLLSGQPRIWHRDGVKISCLRAANSVITALISPFVQQPGFDSFPGLSPISGTVQPIVVESTTPTPNPATRVSVTAATGVPCMNANSISLVDDTCLYRAN
jgi:hypothetical protein